MMTEITTLQPTRVWKHFYDICQIPHESKNEQALADYVLKFGQDLRLESFKDKIGNVIIRKPAAKGKENVPTVTLQGHLDMVAQKNTGVEHDFSKDSIKPYINGEWVMAKDTTLGADNGLGLAAAMAILEDTELKLGPVECLFTVDEEAGMTGAIGLNKDSLQGSYLINLDTEEDEIIVGCAGGLDTVIEAVLETQNVSDELKGYQISVTGLKGGHSGTDIHVGRANAIKLLTGLLKTLNEKYGACLANMNAGNARNAIPRESYAVIAVKKEYYEAMLSTMQAYLQEAQAQYIKTDPGINIAIEETGLPTIVVSQDSTLLLSACLQECPNGVIKNDDELNIVQTSTNLGVAKVENGKFEAVTLQRSSVDSECKDLSNKVAAVFSKLPQVNTRTEGGYPGWKPEMDSELLKTVMAVYEELFQKQPVVNAIHAGLECAILKKTCPHIQMLSIGPIILDAHSPDEKLHIESVTKFWELLIKTLQSL